MHLKQYMFLLIVVKQCDSNYIQYKKYEKNFFGKERIQEGRRSNKLCEKKKYCNVIFRTFHL